MIQAALIFLFSILNKMLLMFKKMCLQLLSHNTSPSWKGIQFDPFYFLSLNLKVYISGFGICKCINKNTSFVIFAVIFALETEKL